MFIKDALKDVFLFILSFPKNLKNGNSISAVIRQSKLDKSSKLSKNVKIYWSNVGNYSYVGENSKIMRTKIGNYCSIGSGVEIGVPSHPMNKISTSPVFFSNQNIFGENFSYLIETDPYKETVIGNDVWIGTNSLIKGGLHIGDGAILGMGSIVTHDVPAFEIWAGNPAKKIKNRFSDDTTDMLKESCWWNAETSNIEAVAKITVEPESFVEELKNENNSY